MKKLQGCFVMICLSFGMIDNGFLGQSSDDSVVYNQMTTIKGHVEILNNPVLGKTAGAGIYIVFQRVDCKKCLIGVFADANGDYRVRLGQGKYKVIVHNPSTSFDMLAPDQPRYVTATSPIVDTVFDIKLSIPPDKK